MDLYGKKDFKGAHERYKEIVKHAPGIYDAHINLGNIEESLMLFKDAAATYKVAIGIDSSNVKGYNAVCRLLLMEVTGASAGRFEVSQAQRLKAFTDAKQYCADALVADPDDASANMNMGMVYKESLEFDSAIVYFQRAHDVNPDDPVVLSNLATTMSRNDRVPEAMAMSQKLLKLAKEKEHLSAMSDDFEATTEYSLGTIVAPFNRSSEVGKQGHLNGMLAKVARGPPPVSPKKCKKGGKKGKKSKSKSKSQGRVLRLNYLDADDVELDVIEIIETDSYFGQDGPNVHGSKKKLDKYGVGAIPLRFIDKQTISVTIRDVFVEGAGGVMYTDCEVYAVIGLNTDIPRDYTGKASTTESIGTPVVSLLHPSISNYYHWTAEGATRLLLSLDHFIGTKNSPGVEPEARLLIPSKITSPAVHEFLELFGVKLKHKPIIYDPKMGKRYKFKKLHRIDWVQLNNDDPEQNDLWSDYLPSRLALDRLREAAAAHQAARRAKAKAKAPPRQYPEVIYLGRHGVREVAEEQILVKMLQRRFGDNFYTHDIDTSNRKRKRSTPRAKLTLQDQMDLFEHAKIVIGAHGAGIVNMVYTASNLTVVEFPMRPHCNRCFGYLSMALGVDYWVVPEVNTFYHLKYAMSKKKAKAVMDTVEEAMARRGITEQLTTRKGKIDLPGTRARSADGDDDDDEEHDEL